MATLATVTGFANAQLFDGGIGVNANDVVVQTGDMSRFDQFMLMTSAGAAQVLVSLDGTNYATAPLSLVDLGATTTNPVIVTAPLRMYAFYGTYRSIKVTQNGATAVTGAQLMCSRPGKAG